jgi:hypothetical protein
MTSGMIANNNQRYYKPSWIDRFNNWVEKLPVRTWIFHVVFGIVLILVQILFLWLDGALHAEELLPVIIFNGLATPFLLAMIQLFDNQAVTALNSMKPMLDTTESEFDQYEYKLANMPSRAALIAGLILLVAVIAMEQLSTMPSRYEALEQQPIFAVVFHIIDKSSAFMYGVMVYHTIRQLRLVNTINSRYLRISLFNVGPSQAFSKLTASTAVGLVFGVYAWMLLNPELLAEPISVGFAASLTVLAVAVFIWPLLGAHRLLVKEKERALHEISLRFEAVFLKFNQRINDEDYAATERLSRTITSLEIQHKRISAIPTWPWSSETARLALTAIALPLMLMILQYFVLQTLNQ